MNDNSLRNIDSALAIVNPETGYYQHQKENFQYTESVKKIIVQYKCYWLLDLIASHQPKNRDTNITEITFQYWELKNQDDKTAVVIMTDENGLVTEQKISDKNFLPNQIKLDMVHDVLMLPNEYCIIEQIL